MPGYVGEEHNHIVYRFGKGYKEYVKTTKELLKDFKRVNLNRKTQRDAKQIYTYSTPLPSPIQFESKRFSIDPYVMGYALANGYFKNGTISTHKDDKEEIMGYFIQSGESIGSTQCYGNATRFYNLGLRTKLVDFKELTSRTKYIPEEYFLGDDKQRLALLRGLLDGDGTISKNGGVSYCSYSKELAGGIRQLVLSLGGIAEVRKSVSHDSYRVTINMKVCPFLLKRKALKWKPSKRKGRTIINIEEIPLQEEGYCIAVVCYKVVFCYITLAFTLNSNTIALLLKRCMD